MNAVGRLIPAVQGKGAQPPIERRISELASDQHGVVTRAQLRALGLSDGRIDRGMEDGRLHPVHRGVFAVRHPLLTPKGRWLAGVLALGEGTVLSHASAAALWEIRESRSRVVHVTVPTRNGRKRRRGIVVHRSALYPADVTCRERIAVTSVARTVIDLAEALTPRALERAVDEAERLGLFDVDAVEATIERNRPRRGAALLSSLLETHRPGTTITKSELEELFLELCRAHSLPSPAVNARVGRYVVDFLWREQRVIVETDGRATHGTRAAFERDRARDARLTAAGYRVLRFTYRQVVHEPAVVADLLRSVLEA